MKFLNMFALFALTAVAAPAVAAFTPSNGKPTVTSTPDGGYGKATKGTMVNFDDATPKGFTVSFNAEGAGVYKGNNTPFAAELYGQSSNYVGSGRGGTGVTISGKGSYDKLSFDWGTVDYYNLIEFFDGDKLITSYSGAQFGKAFGLGNLTDIPNGAKATDPRANRTAYFAFEDGATFNAVRLTSTNYAFEADNFSFGTAGAVPEPATWAMLILGFGIVGAQLRRRAPNAVMA